MSPDHQPLLELRHRRPAIGLRQAQQLLARTNGDVAAAVRLFEEHAVTTVTQRAGVMAAVAAEHLRRCGYDIHAALTSIEGEQYTLTERILRRYEHKPEQALGHLLTVVEHANGLPRSFWLNLEDVQQLNGPQYCFAVLCEWLNYEDWEGEFGWFHAQAVSLLYHALHFSELADCVQALTQRQLELRAQYAAADFQTLLDARHHDPQLQHYHAQFALLRPELINQLLTYVRQNLASFP